MNTKEDEAYAQKIENLFELYYFEEEGDASEQGYDLASDLTLMDWPENNEQLEWLWEHIEESGGKDHIMEALVKFLMIDGINDTNMPKIGSLLDLKPGEFMKHAVKEENIVWALAHSLPQEYNVKAFEGLLDVSEQESPDQEEQLEDWMVPQDNSEERTRTLKYICVMVKNSSELEDVLAARSSGVTKLMDQYGSGVAPELVSRTKKLLLERQVEQAGRKAGFGQKSKPNM